MLDDPNNDAVVVVVAAAPKVDEPPNTFLLALVVLGEAPNPLKNPLPPPAEAAAVPPNKLPEADPVLVEDGTAAPPPKRDVV